MEQVSWIHNKTSEKSVHHVVQEDRKTQYGNVSTNGWGHVLRHSSMLRDISDERMLEKNTVGRRRKQTVDDVIA